ncbi:MAG: N-acetyltransferase [Pseudomonadota bacterium]|nr:N-acetyltransferase [Pseudomonadota bacterium]
MTSISNFDVRAPAFAGVVGKPNLTIASESPADSWAREHLLDEAFGAARSGKTAERLREGRLPAQGLALAAKDAGKLIGTVRMWHILAGEVQALLLGPLAVAKAYRSRGLGRRLMAEALFRAASAGHKAVLLVGDAPYYEPVGFSRRHTLGLSLPGPVDEARFLGLELKGGALKAARGFVVAAGARDLPAYRGAIAFRRAA